MNQINEIKLLNIRFGSYSKLSLILGLSIGIIIGILSFIASLFGLNVNATLGSMELHGIKAGILSLFLEPLIFIILCLVFSTFAYLPFKLGYKVLKGVSIKGDFEVLNQEDISSNDIEHSDRLE